MRYLEYAQEARSSRNSLTPPVSPLLKLPGELRNLIYTYVLRSGTYTFVRVRMRDGRLRYVDGGLEDDQYTHPHRLALLQTCQAIHHETALLPFLLNTFRFTSLWTFEKMLFGRLTALQRQSLTNIEIADSMCSGAEAFFRGMRKRQGLQRGRIHTEGSRNRRAATRRKRHDALYHCEGQMPRLQSAKLEVRETEQIWKVWGSSGIAKGMTKRVAMLRKWIVASSSGSVDVVESWVPLGEAGDVEGWVPLEEAGDVEYM